MSTNEPNPPDKPTGSTPAEPAMYSVVPEEPRPAPPANAPRGRIDKPGLTEDFPEDADFDHDPELTKVITGKSGTRSAPHGPGSGADAQSAQHPADFVPTGMGPPMLWIIVGGVLLLVALVFTGVNAPDKTPYRVLLTLYTVALHTGTGVVALYVAAALVRQIVGRIDLAASRMFAGVAAFAAIFSLKLHLTSYPVVDNAARLLLAALSYLAIVAVTFRLWKRETLGYVVGGHFVLWLVVQIAMLLSSTIATK